MIGRAGLAAGLLALCWAEPALSWTAWNGHRVNPLDRADAATHQFEVINRVGTGPRQYWCAAGDYAMRVLGAPDTARVYVTRPRGPARSQPDKTGVQFGLTPPPGDLPPDSYSLTVDVPGENLSVAFARQYCHDIDRFDPLRRWP